MSFDLRFLRVVACFSLECPVVQFRNNTPENQKLDTDFVEHKDEESNTEQHSTLHRVFLMFNRYELF